MVIQSDIPECTVRARSADEILDQLKRTQGALKETREALQGERERLRTIMEKSPLGVALIDRDNRYTFLNPLFLKLFGYTLAEIPTGSDWFARAFPDPDERKEAISAWKRDLEGSKTGDVRPRICRVTCKNGSKRWIHFRPVSMEDGSQVVFCDDITERRQMEMQLQRSQRLEAIGTLAGGIAHDFNNILSAITGNAEIALLNEIPPDSPARYSIRQILKASKRAAGLVHQILKFSRQREQDAGPIDIVPIVKEVGKLIRASVPATIDIRVALGLPKAMIIGDPGGIHQVLMNLLTNAVYAMRITGGKLTVDLEETILNAKTAAGYPNLPAGPYIRLGVGDTGQGMSLAVQERIFEPYFTTKQKGEGTGLGLSVAHGIVTGLGGWIGAESEEGRGSRFDVLLPRIFTAVQNHAGGSEWVPRGTERILLVDDEKMMVDIGRRVLESVGYTVDTCKDGPSALKRFREAPNRYDLVITDMTMPGLTGDRLAMEMMNIRPDIPVILCTGYSEMITREKARALGIKDLIMKPLLRRDIALAIRQALDA